MGYRLVVFDGRHVRIDVDAQTLTLIAGNEVIAEYPISSALNGVGEHFGSGCTPRGQHKVRLKIGEGLPINSVFVGRRPTGEIYSEALAIEWPDRDWILTRILWLTGVEPGKNRFGDRDTLRRFIYIHGCPDSEPMGVPRSHGCIRMRNQDLITLFDQVENDMPVEIVAPIEV